MSDKFGFSWGDGENESISVESDERYAILVKLTEKDYKIKNHGTVYILWGNGVEGTISLSQYMLHNYKDIIKRVKNRQHFFIAFKLKRGTGIINSKSFMDLTKEMFGE